MSAASNSSPTPYASPAEFLLFFDYNFPGLLVRDDDSQASSTELLTDPTLAMLLMAASGRVEMGCSGRSGIRPRTWATSRACRWRLSSRLSAGSPWGLRNRRGLMEQAIYPIVKQAEDDLNDLATGEMVLSLLATEEAGGPTVESMQTGDFFNLRTLLTNNTRAWGVRANRGGYGLGAGGDSYGCF